MRFDPASLLTLALALLSAAVSYGGGLVRDGYQDRDISGLQRALEMERAERLSQQAQDRQARMAWLMQRSDRRLDPVLSDIATGGGINPR